MGDDKELVKKQIEEFLAARGRFFEVLDASVPKKGNSTAFDFDACNEPSLKALYKEFYAYDYAVRKMLPHIYKKFDLSFNVWDLTL